MEYTVDKLARLAGVSTRTLRYYDQIGLLVPARVSSNGYRIYGEKEVDTLQQILFFRALGLELSTIADIMKDASFNRLETLRSHLLALETKKQQLNLLIANVQKTIQKEEGNITMHDTEKFEGLKKQLVDENEQKYGREVREKYGDKTVDESNAKMLNMSKEKYDAMQADAQAILDMLAEAVTQGISPESDAGREIAALHKKWLGYTWPQYTKEAHLGLVQMYIDDERFAAYYDKAQPGAALFLRDAVTHWANAL